MKKDSIKVLEFILKSYPELVVYSNKDTRTTTAESTMLPGCIITDLIKIVENEKLHFYVTNDYNGNTQFKMYQV